MGNSVQGWTQKALVGFFMGGLKPKIANEICLFQPKNLKEAISLAWMREDQLDQLRQFTRTERLNSNTHTQTLTITSSSSGAPMPKLTKQLSWEEMQKGRAQGLCFNYDERFVVNHRCRKL